MNSVEIKDRTRLVLAKTLKINPESISENASQLDLSEWDSVRHMNVVIALENEFEIEFNDAELPALTSLPLLIAAVEKHTTKP